MLGRRVELLLVRDLGDLAEVHHHHPVGDVPDDVQVVRDEDVGEPEVALQVLEQVEDLRLHRHVEGGDRLVADDQLRVDGERARDADPLALPAGELVREAVVVLRVEADDLEQLLDAALDLRVGADLVHLERLGDDEADALALVQARVRVLEDHHQLAADRAHVGPVQVRDVAAVEGDPAARRIEQAHQAARHRRLAAARLADDAERLTLLDGEADPVDGLDARDLLLEDDPARDREVLDEVLDDEQVVAAPCRRPSTDLRQRAGEQLRGLAVLRRLVEVARLQVPRLGSRPAAAPAASTCRRPSRRGSGDGSGSPWAGSAATAAGPGSGRAARRRRRSAAASRAAPTCRGGAAA